MSSQIPLETYPTWPGGHYSLYLTVFTSVGSDFALPTCFQPLSLSVPVEFGSKTAARGSLSKGACFAF